MLQRLFDPSYDFIFCSDGQWITIFYSKVVFTVENQSNLWLSLQKWTNWQCLHLYFAGLEHRKQRLSGSWPIVVTSVDPGLATGILFSGWSRNIRHYPHIPAPADVGWVFLDISYLFWRFRAPEFFIIKPMAMYQIETHQSFETYNSLKLKTLWNL